MPMEFRAPSVISDPVVHQTVAAPRTAGWLAASTVWPHWGHALALFGLVVAVVIYYFDYLTGAGHIWEDALAYYYPAVNYACTALASGRFPFWLPGLLNGIPLYTDFQTSLYYPIQYLLVLFVRDGELPVVVYQWYLVAHVLFGGLGLYAYAVSQRLQPVAGLVGALTFCFAGFAALQVTHVTAVMVYSWLPVQLYLVDRVVVHRRRMDYGALMAAILVAVFAGFPQVLLYNSYFLIAYWLYRAYTVTGVPFKLSWLAREGLRVAGVFGVVLLLAAIAVLPTIEHWSLSERQTMGFSAAAAQSMPWRNLIQFLVPNFQGFSAQFVNTPHPFWGVTPAVEAGAISGSPLQYLEFGAYAGQLGCLAFIAVVMDRAFRRQPLVRFFAVTWVLALWFMLGRFGGLFGVLYDYLPGIALFRTPARMACVVGCSAAVLAAILVDAVWKRTGVQVWRSLGVVFGCYVVIGGILLVAGARLYPELQEPGVAAFSRAQTVTGLILLAGIAVCLLTLVKSQHWLLRMVSGIGLATLTFSDLYSAYAFFHSGTVNPTEYLNFNSSVIKQHRMHVAQVGPIRFAQMVDQRYEQFVVDSNAALWHRDLETPHGYFDLIPRHIAGILRLTNHTAALDLQNVGTMLQADASRTVISGKWRTGWLPRVKFYKAVREYESPAEVLRDFDRGTLDYHNIAAIPAGHLRTPLPPMTTDPATYSINILPIAPELYRVNYNVNSPGLLFISETHYPGWEAVDDRGRTLPIVPTFTAFKGVHIAEAGQGEICFRFRPASFRLGAALSGVTALLLVGWIMLGWWREGRLA
ncbi:MAG: hypothetical protein PCFJNLEI_03579 [Verrucomicrobiae bacterium]|nr:hypothetical protein [Verrucomicrobiae bacterium]